MTKDSILALYGAAPTTTPNLGQLYNGGGQFNYAASQTMPQMGGFGTVAGAQFGNSGGNQLMGQMGGGAANQNYLQQQQLHAGGNAALFGASKFGDASGFTQFPQQQQQQQQPTALFGQFAPPNRTANMAMAPRFNQPSNQVPPTNANLNQDFGSLNLGNVWQ